MSLPFLNRWYKRKYHPEYVKITLIQSMDKMYGTSYCTYTNWTDRGAMIIDRGWVTDVDCLSDHFKEIKDEVTKVLEILYE